MQTSTRELRSRARGTEPPPTVITVARHRIDLRKAAFWSALIGAPALIGAGAARLFGTRRAGLLAGGLTALGLGGVRWQLQRLFNDEPDHELERRIGRLEIRRMTPRVEARTSVDVEDFDQALQLGFERLFDYINGGNRTVETIEMTSPVTATHRLGFTIGFVMPPGRTRASLPVPDDDTILLSEVPSQRIAALRFAGRYDADNVGTHESELLRLVAEAGLEAFGPIVFAGYDPPSTLPILRRNELWVELAR
ncbi:MAG TPA: heme-binding protein [Kofleriaceae bacterium]|nr:heme-binding protein [Kofleriaceae bacterium]